MAGGCSRREGKGLCGLSDGQSVRTESVWDSMMAEFSCARCNVLTDGPTDRGLLCTGRVAVKGASEADGRRMEERRVAYDTAALAPERAKDEGAVCKGWRWEGRRAMSMVVRDDVVERRTKSSPGGGGGTAVSGAVDLCWPATFGSRQRGGGAPANREATQTREKTRRKARARRWIASVRTAGRLYRRNRLDSVLADESVLSPRIAAAATVDSCSIAMSKRGYGHQVRTGCCFAGREKEKESGRPNGPFSRHFWRFSPAHLLTNGGRSVSRCAASVGLTGPHARGFHTHLHSASLPRAPIRAYKRDCIGLHRNVPQSQVCPRCKARQISGKIKLPKPETQIRSTRHAPHGRLSGTADEQRPCLCPSRSVCHPDPPPPPTPPSRLSSIVRAGEKKSVCGYRQHTGHHHPAPWSRARSLPANPANTV
ncbi:hypothetical protein L1887_42096 [Cichorium endivia]|nr:hypothetical protein L1887_42096 [Cichorium endivia]